MEVAVFVDGGCKGNGTKNTEAYASFAVFVDQKIQRHRKIENLNASTNNEAEYAALLHLFNYIDEVETSSPKNTKLEWIVYLDSALVYNQLDGNWKVKADNIRKLHTPAKAWLQTHNNVGLVKTDRDIIEAVLGH